MFLRFRFENSIIKSLDVKKTDRILVIGYCFKRKSIKKASLLKGIHQQQLSYEKDIYNKIFVFNSFCSQTQMKKVNFLSCLFKLISPDGIVYFYEKLDDEKSMYEIFNIFELYKVLTYQYDLNRKHKFIKILCKKKEVLK